MRALRAIQLTLKVFHWAMMLEGVRDRARVTKNSIAKRAAGLAKTRAKKRRKAKTLFGKKAQPLFGKKQSRGFFGRRAAA